MSEEFFYRYTSHRVSAGCDEYGDPLPWAGDLHLYFLKFKVLKRTACGAWLQDSTQPRGKRFVLLTANKRFALPTRREALESFIARKKRQKRILVSQMYETDRAMKLAEERLCEEVPS